MAFVRTRVLLQLNSGVRVLSTPLKNNNNIGKVTDSLSLEQQPIPSYSSDQIRIRVKACGVCHRDILDRQGAFPFLKKGVITGHEAAGIVDEVGENVREFKKGDKVVTLHWAPCGHCEFCQCGKTTHCLNRRDTFLGLTTDGGYANYLVNKSSGFALVPNGFSAIEASSIMCTYGTFWHAALVRGRLKPTESILISGATGGVGSAAVQISKALGCNVFALTSSEDKVDYLKELGADEVIVSKDGKKFNKDPRLLKGVDMAFEAVGAPTFQSMLRSLNVGGRLILIGNVSNATVELPLGFPIINDLEIIGSDSCTREELRSCFSFLLKTGIRPRISSVLPLKDFAKAQEILENRKVTGRVILQCDETDW